MAELYRQKVTDLARALEHPDTRTEAADAIRGLIAAIVLTPGQGALQIESKGNLAAMLSAAENSKRSPETGDLLLQVAIVAGAGFEPATQMLRLSRQRD
jgi:site-specific DNA recombinase